MVLFPGTANQDRICIRISQIKMGVTFYYPYAHIRLDPLDRLGLANYAEVITL